MTLCPHCKLAHAPGITRCQAPANVSLGKAVTIPDAEEEANGPPARRDPLIGAVVGSWTITHQLGQGGMGKVFAARDPDSGAQVAVKVLELSEKAFAGLTDEEQRGLLLGARLRFAREIEAAIAVGENQPNIIQILKAGKLDDGRPFFAMEYLHGRPLAERICEDPPRGVELRRLLEQVCDALLVIHRAGILHRDLKPENIWVVEPKNALSFAKILDFGVSKVEGASPLTQLGGVVGSPCYMAPEQARGKEVDERSDIYSLGSVLREIVTGECLFGGHERSLTAVLSDVLSTPAPPVVPRDGFAVSSELERLIADCLQKEPALRPQNMAEFKARLLPALEACANCEGTAGASDRSNVGAGPPRSALSAVGIVPATEVRLPAGLTRSRLALSIGLGLAALGSIIGLLAWRGGAPVATATAASTPARTAAAPVAPAAPATLPTPPPAALDLATPRRSPPVAGIPRPRLAARQTSPSRPAGASLQPGPAPSAPVHAATMPVDKLPPAQPLPPAPERIMAPATEAPKPSRTLTPSERDLITDERVLLGK